VTKQLALVFPGQGSQAVGMGKVFFEKSAAARLLAKEANEVLHTNLTDLMFEGPVEQLSLTRNSQLAIFVTSAMMLAVIKERTPEIFENVACVAGHSIGEYAALLAAESLLFSNLLSLIKIRAKAMEEASPPNGAMCALLGIQIEQMIEIIGNYTKDKYRCSIANDNCPEQVVITGLLPDVEAVRDLAVKNGARKGIMLAVSGPFHSPWMVEAAEKIRQTLETMSIQDAIIPIIANCTAKHTQKAADIKELLPKQITGVVRWRESVSEMQRLGVKEIMEVGNGNVLSGLIRRCLPDIVIHPLDIYTGAPKECGF
jgi:[acyl-carrier-protein] S-malonyltransferase